MLQLSSGSVFSLRSLIALELFPFSNIAALELAGEAMREALDRADKRHRHSWRQRIPLAAKQLKKISHDPELTAKARNILQQSAERRPASDEARLFSDAMNLDDFGLHGLLAHALAVGASGGDLGQLLEHFEQQEAYGYWQARLKDDFHFEPVRRLAARRLEHLRQLRIMLKEESHARG